MNQPNRQCMDCLGWELDDGTCELCCCDDDFADEEEENESSPAGKTP